MTKSASEESLRIRKYLATAEPEMPFSPWVKQLGPEATVFAAEGFEERGLGVLRRLFEARIRVPRLVLGRYVPGQEANKRYREEFEALGRAVADRFSIVENNDDGSWVEEGLSTLDTRYAILDVSALSNRALFGSLDALRNATCEAGLAYSEASSYWPTKRAWLAFKKGFAVGRGEELGAEFDLQPYLYGGEHKVTLLPHHEGYDTPGAKLALVAFLPFKAARLAAILSWAEYAKYVLVAGRPRLERNRWRVRVLKEVNARQIHGRRVFDLQTFGYLKCLGELANLLERQRTLERYDIHLSPLGSKLQNIACWILTTIIPSITVLVSVPRTYYADAYSDGIGRSWGFRLRRPPTGPTVASDYPDETRGRPAGQ